MRSRAGVQATRPPLGSMVVRRVTAPRAAASGVGSGAAGERRSEARQPPASVAARVAASATETTAARRMASGADERGRGGAIHRRRERFQEDRGAVRSRTGGELTRQAVRVGAELWLPEQLFHG